MLLEPLRQLVVGDAFDERADLGVAELGLRLPLELRVPQLHRDDRGESFADVFALEVLVLLLEVALLAGVAVHHVGERLLEALLVHPAFGRRDVVGERVDALVVAVVPLHRDLDLAAGVGVTDRHDRVEDRLSRSVEVHDEVDDAAVVLEDLFEWFVGPLVAEDDLETTVEERHLAQSLDQRLRAEVELFHDRRVGPERDRGPGAVGVAGTRQRRSRCPAVLERLGVVAAVAVDRELEPSRERVDDGDAHAVQSAGDLVALASELAARVQCRQHDLGRGLIRVFGMRIDRDAASVVDDATPAIGEQRHIDPARMPREGLVDGVVHDLVDEVVEARRTGRADVHAGPFTHRLQALENRDVLGRVRHASVLRSAPLIGR